MTLRLTPDMLAGCYDFLRTTEPFKAWKLPESDDIGFSVVRDPHTYADFKVIDGVPTIRVSENSVGHSYTLITKMAHEAIHLRQHLTGDKEVHGARFKAMAKRVCAAHGFDLKTF